MKNLSVVLIAVIAFAGLAFIAPTKFGHIDSQALISSMQETKTAQAKLDSFMSEIRNQIDEMQVEYNQKLKDYQDKQATWSALTKENKEKELADLQQRAYEFQQSVNQRVQQKQAELFQPIKEKALKAIEKVGETNGFIYIFDTSGGALLYHSSVSQDVLPLAKKELGMTE